MMLLLKIIAFVFLVPGFAISFGAGMIVSRFKLDQKVKVDFEHEMSEEELQKYKMNRALVNCKMLGMIITIPGLIILIVAFR
jgi:flagellar biosynthesis component FlhA